MISEVVNDIYRDHVLVPGGWRANVIEVEANADDFQWLVSALVETLDMDPHKAVEAALRMVQDRYSFGYTHGLRMSIIGYAHRYLKLYPDLAQQVGDGKVIPRGFRPEIMQHYYLPTIGHRIEGGVDHVLEQMAREARMLK